MVVFLTLVSGGALTCRWMSRLERKETPRGQKLVVRCFKTIFQRLEKTSMMVLWRLTSVANPLDILIPNTGSRLFVRE